MAGFSLLLALIVRLLVPYLETQLSYSLAPWYQIIVLGLILLGTSISGGMVGFSIIDDRDDQILQAIEVSPVSFELFLDIRLGLCIVLGWVMGILIPLIAQLGDIPFHVRFLVPISAGLFSSLCAMLVNFFASNKVEGFAMMKAVGFIVAFPIASQFFSDFKQYFFAIEPNFWTAKAFSLSLTAHVDSGEFWFFWAVGIVYLLLLNLLVFKIFKKRITR